MQVRGAKLAIFAVAAFIAGCAGSIFGAQAGARHAFDAQLYWPGIGWVPPDELVLRRLLPMAHEGLRDCGVSDTARERFLGVIEQRCLAQRTGSTWQRATVARLEDRGMDRDSALVGMLRRYIDLAASNQPVHTWMVI